MADETYDKYSRYTDVEYLSLQGLREKLGMALALDYLWAGVLEYRNRPANRNNINLRSLGSSSLLHYTATPIMKNRIYIPFESMVNDFKNKYRELSLDRIAKSEFVKRCRKEALMGADKLEGAGCGESSINAILGGYFHENDPKKKLLANYHEILADFDEIIEDTKVENVSDSIEQFLGVCMERLYDTEDLESFYRRYDPHRGYVTDSAPQFAPAETISSRMNGLWNYLSESTDPSWLSALFAAYYVRYVNPFDMDQGKNHNAILGVLIARYALHESEYAAISSFIPIEEALIFEDHYLRYEDVEARKDGDITYFLLDAMKKVGELLENLLNDIQSMQNSEIAKEYVEIPKEEIEQAKKEVMEAKEEALFEEPKPVAPKEEPRATSSPVKDVKDAAEFEMPSDAGEYALTPPKEIPSEKLNAANKERAKYVLETHPMLRKVQANFYATHCTLGRFYTIQDFKKATRCAYETARTSMELLASEGLYEKLHIKNKFVYTPVRQGGK
ncbi:MAG: hypothetical protein K6B65_07115 [Bacilli bacterium]|nr:hypothetical protein [Bacilli bacterium]